MTGGDRQQMAASRRPATGHVDAGPAGPAGRGGRALPVPGRRATRVVDPGTAITEARRPDLPGAAPTGLDAGWRPCVRRSAARAVSATLRVGYLTPGGGSLQLIESNEPAESLLARELATRPPGRRSGHRGWAGMAVLPGTGGRTGPRPYAPVDDGDRDRPGPASRTGYVGIGATVSRPAGVFRLDRLSYALKCRIANLGRAETPPEVDCDQTSSGPSLDSRRSHRSRLPRPRARARTTVPARRRRRARPPPRRCTRPRPRPRARASSSPSPTATSSPATASRTARAARPA